MRYQFAVCIFISNFSKHPCVYPTILGKYLGCEVVWIDPDNIMLSEISQTEEDKCYMISLVCGI